MSEGRRRRPKVVVMGATAEEPPPDIEAASAMADLSYAATAPALAEAIADADALFAWRSVRELLPEVWPKAAHLRWIQSASDGVDWLLFPELIESDVVVTNARGIFDQAIAEYVVGLMLAFAKGLLGVIEGQRHREWGGAGVGFAGAVGGFGAGAVLMVSLLGAGRGVSVGPAGPGPPRPAGVPSRSSTWPGRSGSRRWSSVDPARPRGPTTWWMHFPPPRPPGTSSMPRCSDRCDRAPGSSTWAGAPRSMRSR